MGQHVRRSAAIAAARRRRAFEPAARGRISRAAASLRSIADRASADELFQETWSRLIASRERYRVEAKFSTWLLQIAHNLIVDKSGRVWFSGNRNGSIGWLDAATGKTTVYRMPDPAAQDPHTMIFDRTGNMWFTAQFSNFVGHLDTGSGKVRLMRAPTKDARPYGIVVDPSGRPWFDEFGTNKLATIDPKTMAIREYTLPNERTRPRRIAVTSDGILWYGDYTRGMLGRLDPRTGAVREFPLPAAAQSLPYAMASDDKDRIWLAETGIQPNRLVGFDPKSESWISVTPITQSGGLTIRHMIYHGSTHSLWFGTDANTIGRARIPE